MVAMMAAQLVVCACHDEYSLLPVLYGWLVLYGWHHRMVVAVWLPWWQYNLLFSAVAMVAAQGG